MKNMKRLISILMAVMLLAGSFGGAMAETTAKWSQEDTGEGWIKVTQDGGATLGYSTESGVTIIEDDGYAFKDLNRNGALDAYEDWRLDYETRIADLVARLSVEEILALMIHPTVMGFEDDYSDGFTKEISGSAMEFVDNGVRSYLTRGENYSRLAEVTFNNNMQARAEASHYGIPVNVSTDPRTNTCLPITNLALAMTFDLDLAQRFGDVRAKEMRSVGITTELGPQMDLTTDSRWQASGSFSEDPALSRDMVNAVVSGMQSTYDAEGVDLGWGDDSVNSTMKHWPGNAAGEGGREGHGSYGKYTVYPGDQFETGLIPFIDGALNLDSSTGFAAGTMTSYTVAWSDDGSLGELVGSGFSEYKVQLLRSYGYDGLIMTDGGVTAMAQYRYGIEDATWQEAIYAALNAGVDQILGEERLDYMLEVYNLFVEENGEEETLERYRKSAARILRVYFQTGLFENAYASAVEAVAFAKSEEVAAIVKEAQNKSIVMVKNEGNAISGNEGGKKTVYVPMSYSPAAAATFFSSAKEAGFTLPMDVDVLEQYFNVVTDTVLEPTGTDAEGKPAYTENDIQRATAEELAECDFMVYFMSKPSTGSGYDSVNQEYIPMSLQYGEYTADSAGVRKESIAGDIVTVELENVYGKLLGQQQENRSYYGNSTVASNLNSLEELLALAEIVPEDLPIVACVNVTGPMIVAEFEDKVDSILFGVSGIMFGDPSYDHFLDVLAGNFEPSGLLAFQIPANMETVEAQYEDVPRDVECHVDSVGNTYDFTFGMNWSGVINDERVAKYNVPALVELETQPVE